MVPDPAFKMLRTSVEDEPIAVLSNCTKEISVSISIWVPSPSIPSAPEPNMEPAKRISASNCPTAVGSK